MRPRARTPQDDLCSRADCSEAARPAGRRPPRAGGSRPSDRDSTGARRAITPRPRRAPRSRSAARRGGERRYSLKAQAEKHLNLQLDKGARLSDWGRRPLHPAQIGYAALDAASALLLYEHQLSRGLRGDYRLRAEAADLQAALPLSSQPASTGHPEESVPADALTPAGEDLSAA